jgi:hypothetical protein
MISILPIIIVPQGLWCGVGTGQARLAGASLTYPANPKSNNDDSDFA